MARRYQSVLVVEMAPVEPEKDSRLKGPCQYRASVKNEAFEGK